MLLCEILRLTNSVSYHEVKHFGQISEYSVLTNSSGLFHMPTYCVSCLQFRVNITLFLPHYVRWISTGFISSIFNKNGCWVPS